MKKRFVVTTLSLCMLLAATPLSASAASKDSGVPICKTINTISCNKSFNNFANKSCNKSYNKSCNKICSDICNKSDSCQEKPNKPSQPNQPNKPVIPTPPGSGTPEQKPDNGGNGNILPGTPNLGGYEQQVVDLVNKERTAAGLKPLKADTKVAGVAEKKAQDMRDNNYFSHTSPIYGSPFDMLKQFGVTYTAAGENIAKGQKSPQTVMNAWMNSSGHRANILSTSFEKIGVGYVTDSRGNTYWVQMFIK